VEWVLLIILGASAVINIMLFNKLRSAQEVIGEVTKATAGFVELSEMVSREIEDIKEAGKK